MGRIDINIHKQRAKGKEFIRISIGFFISILAIAVIAYFVDFAEIRVAFTQANYWLVGGASLITLLWLAVRSIVWRILLKNSVGYKAVFFTLNEGYLLNNVLPFRLGEPGRAFLLSLKTGINFWEILSSIIIERGLDIAMASTLLLLTIPFVANVAWAKEAAVIAGGGILVLFLALYFLALKRQAVENFILNKTGGKGKLNFLITKPFLTFIKGIEVLRTHGIFLKAVVFMMINWLVGIGQYYVFLLAFLPDARFLWACFAMGVAALGIAAPSSPGAVGVLELSLVGALAAFNIDPSVSVAFGIVMHTFQYLITGLLGAYAMGQDGETLSSLYHKIKELRET